MNAIRPSKVYVVIPCSGVGSRSGSVGPKQYELLVGLPIIFHTLSAFAKISRISYTLVVVTPGDDFFDRNPTSSAVVAKCGGATRFATVVNGLRELRRVGAEDHDWVLVHDAVRCLVTPEAINRLMDACENDEVGGLLAYPLSDRVTTGADGRAFKTLPDSNCWGAQTPQMFRMGVLQSALQQTDGSVTDESCAIEMLNLKPLLIPGDRQNFKLTFPEDFVLAEALLRSRR